MAEQHSAGPWKAHVDDDGSLWVVMSETHRAYMGDMENTCGECHANADLAAAAPDLLEAAEAVMHFWESDPEAFGDEATVTSLAGRFAHVADKARAAIAKAKGRQP